MSRTNKHTILGKFNNGLLQDIKNDIPLSVKKLWNRYNNDVGWFKNLRNIKKEKQLDKDMESDILNSL